MAIVFTQSISEQAMLFAYNNHVVRFKHDTPNQPMFAEISLGGKTVSLFPNPSGEFYYNFMELVSNIINTTKFKDDLDLDISALNTINGIVNDFESNVIDDGGVFEAKNCLITLVQELSGLNPVNNWGFRSFFPAVVNYKIVFSNLEENTAVRNYTFIAGALQLIDFKKRYPLFLDNTKLIVLNPIVKNDNSKAYARFWRGLPFDITLYTPLNNWKKFLTNQNYSTFTELSIGRNRVSRIVFSDGRTSVSIEDLLTINYGYNQMVFSAIPPSGSQEELLTFNLHLIKEEAYDCGTYLKFLNSFGGWSYWLFPKAQIDRTNSDLGELYNDFENLEDTISPMIQIGKNSNDVFTVTTDVLDENDMAIMEQLIDSPKIYLFTGEPFTQSYHTDWIEVALRTNNFRIQNAKSEFNRFNFAFEIPKRNNIIL